MEYAMCRAMEINRLSSEQLVSLQVAERNRSRAFLPHEIQEIFKLHPLKIAYEIPDLETAQANHAQRLRNDFYREFLFPEFREISPHQVDKIHEFDDRVMNTPMDYAYRGGPERKKKLRDSLYEETERAIKGTVLIPMALAIAQMWNR